MAPFVLLAIAALQESPELHAAKRASALLSFATRVEEGDDQGPEEARAEQAEKQAALSALISELATAAPRRVEEARRLAAAVAAGDGRQIAVLGARLTRELRADSGWEAVPRTRPGLARGARLYAQACAACHGAAGKPPAGNPLGLSTPPLAFGDPAVARHLSPRRAFDAIAVGVPTTAMPGFDDALGESDRWAIAFYVQALSHERPRSRALAATAPKLSLRDAALASDELLRARFEAAGLPASRVEAAIADLRWRPPARAAPQPAPVVVPDWLLRASLRRDAIVRAGDTVRNEIDVVVPASSRAERSRLLTLVNLVARQAFLRISPEVTDLRVSAWETEEAQRTQAEPVAACALLPAGTVECGVAPPEAFPR